MDLAVNNALKLATRSNDFLKFIVIILNFLQDNLFPF
jgi:hypothetical protein